MSTDYENGHHIVNQKGLNNPHTQSLEVQAEAVVNKPYINVTTLKVFFIVHLHCSLTLHWKTDIMHSDQEQDEKWIAQLV